MTSPSIKKIDEIRHEGFRPGVVGCFLFEKKLLLLFKREYNLWLLPQGGIDNKEKPEEALKREMSEEMGEEFVKSWKRNKPKFIFEDRIEFREDKQGTRELATDAGEEVKMFGKHYYYFAVEVKDEEIEINDTEFDDYVWADFTQAKFLAKRIYQKNKAVAMQEVTEILAKEKLVI